MSSRILRVTAAALSLPLVLGITACSEQQSASSTDSSADTTSASGIDSTFTGSAEIPEALSEPLDVALVIRTTQGGWLEAYTDAVETEVAALGGSLQIYDSQNDLSKMSSNVDTAVNADVDLLLIDNGTQDALGTSVQKAIDADIPVVAYDSDFTIDGVVSVSQDDTALARNGLEQIKTDFDGTAKIVVISVAGYTPLDNRLAEVESFISENPGIEIVAQTGTVSGSASLDTAAQVEAILKAYPDEGEIDAIWTHWNDFSVGAYQALKSQNRSDVALYTVDLTDQNLPYFWDDTVDFQAASATNPALIGVSQVRLGYELVAGEASTDNLVIEPVVVTKADLPDTEITFAELPDYVEGWSKDATEWPAWIQTLEQQSK